MTEPVPGPFVIFDLDGADGHVFGLDVAHVLQIVETGVVTPVPLAPPLVRGIMSHHGRIVTVFDVAPLLGLEPTGRGRPAESTTFVVILRRQEQRTSNLGVQVARIREIVSNADLERVDVAAGPCVGWVSRRGPHLVHMLDFPMLTEALGSQFGAVVTDEVREGAS